MTKPPYPRLGECARAMCIALGSKAGNPVVDRLAREGDFDWAKVDSLIDDLLAEGVRMPLGPVADEVFEPWLQVVHQEYCRLVLVMPLDAVDRGQALTSFS